MAVYLHFIGIVASLCAFDLHFCDSLRALRTEVVLYGVSWEFDPTFCLPPVGDKAKDVSILTWETLLSVILGGQHEIIIGW